MQASSVDRISITGRVLDRRTQQGISGLRVEAWDKDMILDDLVGSAVTDARGVFRIEFGADYYRELFLDRQPDLFFKVYRGDELIRSTEDSVLWNTREREVTIEVDLPPAEEPVEEPGQVMRAFAGQLLHEQQGRPLAGYMVRGYDLNADERDLGFDLTDAQGLFALVYPVPREARPEEPRRWRLHVRDLRGEEIHQVELEIDPEAEGVRQIRVPLPEPLAPEVPTLEELDEALGLQLPPELLAFLQEADIHTLADIRRRGGIREVEGLPVDPDHEAVRLLEAHADLGRLSPDPARNAELIEKGYTSVAAVAGAPRAAFVSGAHEVLGDFGAARLHVEAWAQARFAENVIAGLKAARANDLPLGLNGKADTPLMKKVVPITCGCPDCKAAVGPLAYLADLLNYALDHLKKTRTVPGLKAYYFDNIDLTGLKLIRTDDIVEFDWGSGAPDAAIRPDTFSARWTGYVEPRYSETYTFHTLSDDGVRLWVDGRLIIDNWTDHGFQEDTGTIELTAGRKYDLKLEFYENGGAAGIILSWSSPSHAKETIPKSQLSHTVADIPIDLTYLANTFLQPFSKLPASCEAMKEEVRQVRLCIEVLRSYYETIKHTRPQHMHAALERDEKAYRQQAYEMLLSRIGTSYDELRRAGTADPESREALAKRLGIDVSHLDDLFLEPVDVTEENLEERFGLVDTGRDPLQTAQQSDLEAWRLAYLRARWLEADWPSDPYDDDLSAADRLSFIDPDVIGPDDFRHPVAKAQANAPDQAFDLWIRRRTWVDDRLKAMATLKRADGTPDFTAMIGAMGQPVSYGAAVHVTPWANITPPGIKKLYEDLKQETDLETTGTKIEKDLGLTVAGFTRLMMLWEKDQAADSDIRNERPTREEWREVWGILVQAQKVKFRPVWLAEEEQAKQDGAWDFDLEQFWIALDEPPEGDWPPARLVQEPLIDPERLTLDELPRVEPGRTARRLWQARRAELDLLQADLKAKRAAAAADPYEDLLRSALGIASTDPVPDLAQLAADLKAGGQDAENAEQTIAQDLYMTVPTFERLMEIRAKAKPAASEWAEVDAFLTTAYKLKKAYPGWIQEEEALPFVDPEALGPRDLPELKPAAGKGAFALWEDRESTLAADRQQLKAEREQDGFEAMLLQALGDPDPGDPLPQGIDPAKLGALDEDLKGGDAEKAAEAAQKITTALFLMLEDFERLVVIKAKADQADLAKRPTAAEWVEVYAMLAAAQKQKRHYGAWKTEEKNLPYWMLRKASLPRWRAGVEARRGWQEALRARTGPPLIDPDLIGLQETKGAAAAQIWKDRWQVVNDEYSDLKQAREAAADEGQWLENVVQNALGVPLQDLIDLEEEQEEGVRVAPRLEQLYLTREAFAHLVRVYRALDAGRPVLETEWEALYGLLTQVYKRRRFAAWRREEKEKDLSLSPDFFQIPRVDTSTFPPPAPKPLPAWRASWAERRAWLETLEARIEQEGAAKAALREAVSVAEEETLPLLRDALLCVIGPWEATLADNARWFTDRFQIDAKAGACQKTTRVAQAIETLQGILFGIRTRQLNDVFPDLELDADDFDEEWKWIGSYQTWRAAIFVFMYPENILLPTLRKWQSPGFLKLVDTLRGDRRLSPKQACSAARTYFTYLRDITTLQLEASCEAQARGHSADVCRKGTGLGYHDLVYLFARSSETKKVYWSAYDRYDQTGFGQTFWDEVPGLEKDNVIAVLGAVPYKTPLDQRLIFLFAHVVEEGKQKLVYVKYDLDTAGWVGGLGELKLPKDVTSFTALVCQRTGMSQSPQLLIRAADGAVYQGTLNREGEEWEQDPETPLISKEVGANLELLGMVGEMYPRFYLFVRNRVAENAYRLEFRLFPDLPDKSDSHWRRLGAAGNWAWSGAAEVHEQGKSHVYAFWTERNGPSSAEVTRYQETVQTSALSNITIETIEAFNDWLITASDSRYDLKKVSLEKSSIKWDESDSFSSTHITEALDNNVPGIANLFELLTLDPSDPRRVQLGEHGWDKKGKVGISFLSDHLRVAGVFTAFDPEIRENWREVEAFLDQFEKYKGTSLEIYLYFLFRNEFPTAGPKSSFELPDVAGSLDSDPVSFFSGLRRISVHTKEENLEGSRITAFQRTASQPGLWLAVLLRDVNGALSLSQPLRIAPLIAGPFGVPQHLSEAELQARRAEIQAVFENNTGGTWANVIYQQEAFFFVPLYIALQLQQRGHYTDALDWFRSIYDYSMPTIPGDQREIYYGLKLEEAAPSGYQRAVDWLQDPLNPHAIARTRANTYTRFTLLSLVRCLLDYADAEFTRDTAESLPRARMLYLTALELLGLPELNQRIGACGDLVGTLQIQVGDPVIEAEFEDIKLELVKIEDYEALSGLVAEIKRRLADDDTWNRRFADIRTMIREAKQNLPEKQTLGDVLERQKVQKTEAHRAVLSQPALAAAAERAAEAAGEEFLHRVSAVSGLGSEVLRKERTNLPWLREGVQYTDAADGEGVRRPSMIPVTTNGRNGNVRMDLQPTASGVRHVGVKHIGAAPMLAVKAIQAKKGGYVPGAAYDFCIPPNPVLRALRLRAELNLYKLRNCRNIAGMQRQLEPYAAPTDTTSGLPAIGAGGQLILPGAVTLRPTAYRYSVLIERARHLADRAQQMEAAFLSALEKLDAEQYNLLKARQDMRLARAGVQLQRLRVTEAQGGVKLAELQQDRYEFQANYFQNLLAQGELAWEVAALIVMGSSAALHLLASTFSTSAAVVHFGTAYAQANIPGGQFNAASSVAAGFSATSSALSSVAAAASTGASILQTLASYERRKQEWEFQRTLAEQDGRIAEQQIRMAQDHVRVVEQERAIAEMQTEHAEATVDFLTTKFTNTELYDWMSGVLERVYSFFLQQATSVAHLAAHQLAFERQEVPPPFIQADYWEVPSENGVSISGNGQAADRRGLTGSARLLQDVYLLDQHAFETAKRKHQLTKMISLARMAPYEFQRFRETGVLPFATPMELFDRDFPGHHLRLIHRVRTSVVALIPPTEGIRATLSSRGLSRVVIGGDVYQTVVVRRDPETVALSSPANATGLFELEQQPEMPLPFEHIGVDTSWEFRMPKASNPFDYGTIADVLLTIEYTALDSYDYRQQVIQRLDQSVHADRPFSFRFGFPDAWYDLHNPEQTATPMTVRFEIRREDFPANLSDLTIERALLYFARADGKTAEFPVDLKRVGSKTAGHATAQTVDGVARIASFTGSPAGTWELSLRSDDPKRDQEVRERFKNEEIEDILLVITYSGQTPAWPV